MADRPEYKSIWTGPQVDEAVRKVSQDNVLTTADVLQNLDGSSLTKTVSQAALKNAFGNVLNEQDLADAISDHNSSESAHPFIQGKFDDKVDKQVVYQGKTGTISNSGSNVSLNVNNTSITLNEDEATYQSATKSLGEILNTTDIRNSYGTDQDKTYSANYINSNFVPLTFASRLYMQKVNADTCQLVDTKPTPDNANVITVTTTNTTFDWADPLFTVNRVLESNVVLNKSNSFVIDLYFTLSRAALLTFGSRVKVSTDNGTSWTDISSTQSYGEKSYVHGLNNEDLIVYTDWLSEVEYPKDTIIAIEVFSKAATSPSLTADYYCGVTVDNSDIYSTIEFNFANMNINTNQIEDGAITYEKLSDQLQGDINKAENPDTTPTQDSTNLITSGGVYAALNGKENISNKVTSISSSSTNVEYPGAKSVYDFVNGTTLVFTNTSVSTWVADNTYTDYGYKASITLTGVTASTIPQVIFGATEAVSGNYLPIAESYNGGIYIYSKVNTAITIPTIIIQKAGL